MGKLFTMPSSCRQSHPVLGLPCLLGLNHRGPHKGIYYDLVNWFDDDDFEIEEGHSI